MECEWIYYEAVQKEVGGREEKSTRVGEQKRREKVVGRQSGDREIIPVAEVGKFLVKLLF